MRHLSLTGRLSMETFHLIYYCNIRKLKSQGKNLVKSILSNNLSNSLARTVVALENRT